MSLAELVITSVNHLGTSAVELPDFVPLTGLHNDRPAVDRRAALPPSRKRHLERFICANDRS